MRWLVRRQFTDGAWATVKTIELRNEANDRESGVTHYAAAPVLNTQQLVATWRQHVKSQGRWRSQAIPVDIKDKGVYLVEAVTADLRAYTILFISDLGLITKGTHGRLVAFTADRKSGEPIPDAIISSHDATTKTDAHGLAEVNSNRMGTHLTWSRLSSLTKALISQPRASTLIGCAILRDLDRLRLHRPAGIQAGTSGPF